MASLSMHSSISNTHTSLLLFAYENTSNWECILCQKHLLPWFNPFAQKPTPDRSISCPFLHLFPTYPTIRCTQTAPTRRCFIRSTPLTANCQYSVKPTQETAAFQHQILRVSSSSLVSTGLASPEYLPPAVLRTSRYKNTPFPLMNSLSHVTNSPT